jgi:CRP/FNR family transcriptional regulator, cyclic AMP receptor protein
MTASRTAGSVAGVSVQAAPVEDFWSALEAADADALMAVAMPRTFRRGQVLVYEGQRADKVLVLRSGRVKVASITPNGREVVLAFRGPGELVGELSALDDEPRSASIIAIEKVEALCLPPHEFRAFVTQHPSASLAMLQLLSRRLRDADAKRKEFAALTAIGRVAGQLRELADRFGREDEGAIVITLPLSQEELAGSTGVSLESVARALQTMRSLKCIETGRREIRVLDVEALDALHRAMA